MIYDSNEDTIQVWEHDRDHPYTMVLNALIRDMSISPNCRWLIIYLLSNKKDWKIKVSQVIAHVKGFLGKDAVYALFQEAIDAGYMIRTEYTVGNLKRYAYKLSENRAFKKSPLFPGFQETGAPDTGTPDSKERTMQEKPSQERTSILPSSSDARPPPDKPPIDDACGADDEKNSSSSHAEEDSASDVRVVRTDGKKLCMSLSVIYHHFAKKPYSTDTIREAIRRIRKNTGPINNIISYLETTCQQIDRRAAQAKPDRNSFSKQKTQSKPYPHAEDEDEPVKKPPVKTITYAQYEEMLRNQKS